MQWRMGLPPDLGARVTWRDFGSLRVGIAGRRDLIWLKLFAAADRGGVSRPRSHRSDAGRRRIGRGGRVGQGPGRKHPRVSNDRRRCRPLCPQPPRRRSPVGCSSRRSTCSGDNGGRLAARPPPTRRSRRRSTSRRSVSRRWCSRSTSRACGRRPPIWIRGEARWSACSVSRISLTEVPGQGCRTCNAWRTWRSAWREGCHVGGRSCRPASRRARARRFGREPPVRSSWVAQRWISGCVRRLASGSRPTSSPSCWVNRSASTCGVIAGRARLLDPVGLSRAAGPPRRRHRACRRVADGRGGQDRHAPLGTACWVGPTPSFDGATCAELLGYACAVISVGGPPAERRHPELDYVKGVQLRDIAEAHSIGLLRWNQPITVPESAVLADWRQFHEQLADYFRTVRS